MDTRLDRTGHIDMIVSSFTADIFAQSSRRYRTAAARTGINIILTGRFSDRSLAFAGFDIDMAHTADIAGDLDLVVLHHRVFYAGISIDRYRCFIISICQYFQIQRRIDAAAVGTGIQIDIVSAFQIRISVNLQLIAARQFVFGPGRSRADSAALCIGDSFQSDFCVIAGRQRDILVLFRRFQR